MNQAAHERGANRAHAVRRVQLGEHGSTAQEVIAAAGTNMQPSSLLQWRTLGFSVDMEWQGSARLARYVGSGRQLKAGSDRARPASDQSTARAGEARQTGGQTLPSTPAPPQ